MGFWGGLALGFFAGFLTCLTPALWYDWRDRKNKEPWTRNEDWK